MGLASNFVLLGVLLAGQAVLLQQYFQNSSGTGVEPGSCETWGKAPTRSVLRSRNLPFWQR